MYKDMQPIIRRTLSALGLKMPATNCSPMPLAVRRLLFLHPAERFVPMISSTLSWADTPHLETESLVVPFIGPCVAFTSQAANTLTMSVHVDPVIRQDAPGRLIF